jgi:hypothetical protein
MRSDTGHGSKKADEARRTARKNVRLTVDVKSLRTHEVDNILFGQGFEELHSNSLALSKPRAGMERAATLDISGSGLCINGVPVKRGTAAIVDLHLPEEKVVLKALVEVIWTRQVGEETTAGCRFAAIQEGGTERMERFLGGTN